MLHGGYVAVWIAVANARHIEMAGRDSKVPLYSSFCIVFDRPDAHYQAGEILAGWIDLHLKNDIRVKAMKVHIHGQARVSWAEKRSYTKGASPSVSHKHSEVLLDHQVYLIRKDGNCCPTGNQSQPKKQQRKSLCFPLVSGSEEQEGVVIGAGPHRFSFEYILPRNLPSTFDGKWGQVIYGVKFIMDRPWKTTIEREGTFTVASVVDFNDEPEIVRPISNSDEFNVSSCCFAGEVYIQVRVARKGFIRGEMAPVHVELYNNSGSSTGAARISLNQHAIFRAGTHSKKTSSVLRSVICGDVGADQCKVWDVQLEVPLDAVPSTLRIEDCRGITVRYTISVTIPSSSMWSSDFILPVQVVVGTIPLRRETAQRYLSELLNAAADSSTNSLPVTPQSRLDVKDCNRQHRRASADNVRLTYAESAVKSAAEMPCTVAGLQKKAQSSPDGGNAPSFPNLAPGPRKLNQARRASAFELGAVARVNYSRGGEIVRFSEGRPLSSSLDGMASARTKMTVKEARSRLKSISEVENPKKSSTSHSSSGGGSSSSSNNGSSGGDGSCSASTNEGPQDINIDK